MRARVTGVDHVVVLAGDFEAGIAAYETLLGVAPAWRNRSGGIASALFTLGNMSVEVLTPQGEGKSADRVRAALDANGEGLASLCFRVDDLAGMHRRLSRLGLAPDEIAEGASTDEISGATMRWRRFRAGTEAANGVRLFFLERNDERPRSRTTGQGAIVGLDHVVIATQNPERAAALYGARLGLDMALDRSHPEWGRLMFFRCGDDLIVEIVQRPGTNDAVAPDRLWGLSWRTADIAATRARLVENRLDVSEIRAGRKPGTQVMSLRTGTNRVPTLILQPAG